MDNPGRIFFGVYPTGTGTRITVNTTTTYNDGQWHQVVATLGPNGMQLFIDGTLAPGRTDTTGAMADRRLLADRRRQPRQLAQPSDQPLT